jgi:hypothetical protein
VKVNNASQCIENAKRDLDAFRDKLGDIRDMEDLCVDIDGFLTCIMTQQCKCSIVLLLLIEYNHNKVLKLLVSLGIVKFLGGDYEKDGKFISKIRGIVKTAIE